MYSVIYLGSVKGADNSGTHKLLSSFSHRNELPPEAVVVNGESQPLCMAQYYRIFTSYRLPGITKDTLLKAETEYTKSRPHIIVLCNGEVKEASHTPPPTYHLHLTNTFSPTKFQFYVLHLTKGKNAEPLTESEILSQLMYVLNENVNAKPNSMPVGILTSLKRDSWATLREQLIAGTS